MKNKSLSLKGVLMVAAVGFLSFGFCSATTNFHFNIEAVKAIQESLQDDIMPIHFADNGNDFGGFFYFSNGLGNEAEGGIKKPNYYECTTTNEEGANITLGWVLTVADCTGTTASEPTAYDDKGTQFPTEDPEIEEYQYRVSFNGNEPYVCSRQVKGYYYNAERGERLWPLDGDTRSDKFETTGGFYTMCKKEGYIAALTDCLSGAAAKSSKTNYYDCKDKARDDYATDGDGYYGSIKHLYSGQEMELIAGVKYDTGTKFTSIDASGGLSPTFIRFGNKYPLGFIYDNNGGVGFVGCKITSPKDDGIKKILGRYNNYSSKKGREKLNPLNILFKETGDVVEYKGADVDVNCSDLVWDSLIGVVIEGIVGIGEKGNKADFEVIGNQRDQKMQYFSSANINNNTIINYARKKAELLCRGKWRRDTAVSSTENVICVNNPITSIILTSPSNKPLIVKNGNVTITPSSYPNDTQYYDIFIDSGNLIINETDSTEKFVINDNGFVSNTTPSNFNSNVLVGYLGDTATSESKITECMEYVTNNLPQIKDEICTSFLDSKVNTTVECKVCEEGEICEGGVSCGEDVCAEGEKCEEKSETIQIFDYTGCMKYLTTVEGPCQLTGGLDITMDPNEDGMVNEDDINFITNNSGARSLLGKDVAIASIIKGNFIVDGKVLGPDRPSDTSFNKKLKNKYFIYGKLSSRDSFQSLQDTFAWRCNNGYTTDDSYCLPSNTGYSNPYEDAFLVVIDQNYNSPFLNPS